MPVSLLLRGDARILGGEGGREGEWVNPLLLLIITTCLHSIYKHIDLFLSLSLPPTKNPLARSQQGPEEASGPAIR